MKIFNQLAQRFSEATKVPFDLSPSDSENASLAFHDSALARRASGAESHDSRAGEFQFSLAADAPDVIAVVRHRASK